MRPEQTIKNTCSDMGKGDLKKHIWYLAHIQLYDWNNRNMYEGQMGMYVLSNVLSEEINEKAPLGRRRTS